ncbi:MAG: hypothetical protein CL677_09040 [Bdellovibrionaceae bacterium]|nr:hypothetical protein [Pseudobdellovibrionaceae bacterium]|tara:strand:+ start:355 stop:855 length:501 start_codon:yes stop_codon:yes gene_type:complete
MKIIFSVSIFLLSIVSFADSKVDSESVTLEIKSPIVEKNTFNATTIDGELYLMVVDPLYTTNEMDYFLFNDSETAAGFCSLIKEMDGFRGRNFSLVSSSGRQVRRNSLFDDVMALNVKGEPSEVTSLGHTLKMVTCKEAVSLAEEMCEGTGLSEEDIEACKVAAQK